MLSDTGSKNALVPLVLRLALAAIFIFHGLVKVTGNNNHWGAAWAVNAWEAKARPPQELLGKLDRLENVPAGASEEEKKAAAGRVELVRTQITRFYLEDAQRMPEALSFYAIQIAVAWGEVLGGIALLLGLLTRWAAAGLIVIQLGAIYTVTGARGFSSLEGVGFDFNLALVAMCLALVLSGGGAWAVDRLLRGRARAPEPKPAPPPPAPAAV